MSTMAKNRKSARKSKEKRILNFEDLENDFEFNTTQLQIEVETLAELSKTKAAIADDISKIEEEIRVLKVAKASRE